MAVRKVMAFGTFDSLHPGHLNYLQQAKKLGGKLVVVITSDHWAQEEKSRTPCLPAKERAKLVGALKIVSKAIVGNHGRDKLAVVVKEKPSVLVLGHDLKADIPRLGQLLEARGVRVKIVRAKAYKPSKYKCTLIRNYNSR